MTWETGALNEVQRRTRRLSGLELKPSLRQGWTTSVSRTNINQPSRPTLNPDRKGGAAHKRPAEKDDKASIVLRPEQNRVGRRGRNEDRRPNMIRFRATDERQDHREDHYIDTRPSLFPLYPRVEEILREPSGYNVCMV